MRSLNKKLVFLFLLFIMCTIFQTQIFSSEQEEKNIKILENFWPSHSDIDPIILKTAGDWNFLQLIYSTLVEMGSSNTVRPAMAEKLEQNIDGTKWVFYLRKNLKWSDGTKIESHQVMESIQRALQGTTHTQLSNYVESIETNKEHQIIFKMKKTPDNFLNTIAFIDLAIVHPESYKNKTFTWKTPLSGAFTIQSLEKQKIVLIENPYFWDTSTNRIKTATLIKSNVSSKDMELLLKEDFDAVQLSPGFISIQEDLLKLQKKYTLFSGNTDFLFCLTFSRKRIKDKTLDLSIRRFLYFMIYQEFWREQKNSSFRATGLRPPGSMGALSQQEFDKVFLNLKQAKAKIKKIDLLMSKKFRNRSVVVKLIKTLSGLDFKINEITVPSEKYTAIENSGEYDIAVNFLGASESDPDTAWRIYNGSYFPDSAITQEDLNKAQLESNKEIRLNMYKNLEIRSIEQAFFIPLKNEVTYILTSKKVKLDTFLATDWGLQLHKLKYNK
ncbi:MAG: hypothetical protein HY843_01675 [Bdellovibrio sp.]|nr:hypothetical protein [Bdellovibrio sp.]